MGSGMPDTLLGLGLITGALRGGWFTRGPALGPRGDNGEAPFGRCSPAVMPRCCWRLDTSETRDAFWLSYGEPGLMARWVMPTFMRLSTLLRRESKCELASKLTRLSKPWLSEGRALGCGNVRGFYRKFGPRRT